MSRKELVDELIAEIDRRLDRRFGSLERQIAGIDRDQTSMGKQLDALMRERGVGQIQEEGGGGAVIQIDETWPCVKCGSRLGYYDQTEDVLRVRHKDLTLWFQVGIGGKVSVVCRSCGELNSVSDSGSGEAG